MEEGADIPAANRAFFLAADKGGAASADGKGREAAVIASGLGHPVDFFVGHKRERKLKVKNAKLWKPSGRMFELIPRLPLRLRSGLKAYSERQVRFYVEILSYNPIVGVLYHKMRSLSREFLREKTALT